MNPTQVIDEILKDATLGAEVAQTIQNPDVQAGAALAEVFLRIAQKAVAGYEAQVGKPIDLTQLHDIELLP